MHRFLPTVLSLATLAFCSLANPGAAQAQGDADIETKFIAMLKNATLKGSWAPNSQGRLGGERGDDSYRIARVEKGEGGKWSIVSVFNVRDRQVEFPISASVKFAGDTAVLILDNVRAGPGKANWSARVMFHEGPHQPTGGFALIAHCGSGLDCNRVAAVYKTVVPTSRPEVVCGKPPPTISVGPGASVLEFEPGPQGLTIPREKNLPGKDDVVSQCVRLAACKAERDKKAAERKAAKEKKAAEKKAKKEAAMKAKEEAAAKKKAEAKK